MAIPTVGGSSTDTQIQVVWTGLLSTPANNPEDGGSAILSYNL